MSEDLASLTKTIEDLETQLLAAQDQLAIAEEQKVRALADLQNHQRRESEQKMQWSAMSVASFLKPILGSLQALHLGTEHSEDEALIKTVEAHFQALEKAGLMEIKPDGGEPVNPEKHEVLMMAEGSPGCVVQLLEPGWEYQGTVIAPAKVSGAQQ